MSVFKNVHELCTTVSDGYTEYQYMTEGLLKNL